MRKAILITCNDSYDYNTRTKYVESFLEKRGFEIRYLISDFDHRSKKRYKALREGSIDYIHINSYKKNLSISRIIAQIRFAKGVEKYLEENTPDLVYHCAPPNLAIAIIARVREKKQFVLITEIGDMWPESVPINKLLKKLFIIPLGVWSGFRDRNLYNSDVVVAECDLFRNMLIKKSHFRKIKTIYFCKEFVGAEFAEIPFIKDEIVLVYLGAINNIIDVELIGLLIKEISRDRTVTLHIIGDGENRELLLKTSRSAGAKTVFHGMIFDEDEKKKVFNISHFALNIMKETVLVGMSMKALDYFSFGIPIINNINGDIKRMIVEENIGFNISVNSIKDSVADVLSLSENNYLTLRRNVKLSHNNHFSVEEFENQMLQILRWR